MYCWVGELFWIGFGVTCDVIGREPDEYVVVVVVVEEVVVVVVVVAAAAELLPTEAMITAVRRVFDGGEVVEGVGFDGGGVTP